MCLRWEAALVKQKGPTSAPQHIAESGQVQSVSQVTVGAIQGACVVDNIDRASCPALPHSP